MKLGLLTLALLAAGASAASAQTLLWLTVSESVILSLKSISRATAYIELK